MRHETAAWRIAHSLGVAVDEPQAADQDNQAGGRLALGVKQVEQAIHLGTEAYQDVHDCRQEKTGRHHLLAAHPVGEETVDKAGDTVDHTVQGQEKAQLGFAESEFRLQGRHDDTEILTHEIEQRIADHQDYQGLPLPVIVLFLDALVHRERDYSVLWYLPVKKSGQDKDMNNRK